MVAVNPNVPNLLSLARILAVPVMVWLMLNGRAMGAFWVFVAAGASDALDGFVAKRFGAESELGKYLDPLADKALLVSAYLALGYLGELPLWLVIMVVFRDILIVGGAILLHTITQAMKPRPLLISKINTAAQIILAAGVLANIGFGVDGWADVLVEVMVFAVAASTALSGLAYLEEWSRQAAGRGGA